MQQLKSLSEGGVFRPALDMRDVNGVQLTTDTLLVVERKYDVSPYYVICKRLRSDLKPIPLSRGVCLTPDALTIGPLEEPPTKTKLEDIVALSSKPRRTAIGIKILSDNAAFARITRGVVCNLYQFLMYTERRHLTIKEVASILDRLEVARGARVRSPLLSLLKNLEKKKLLEIVYVYKGAPSAFQELGLMEMYYDALRGAQDFIEAAKNEGVADSEFQPEGNNSSDYETHYEEPSEQQSDTVSVDM